MVEPNDDRLTLEEQIALAADARYGGFFIRRKFRHAFHPHRVLALLHRVEDADKHLHIQDEAWQSSVEHYEAVQKKVFDLLHTWRDLPAAAPYVAQLENALGLAPPEAHEPAPAEAGEGEQQLVVGSDGEVGATGGKKPTPEQIAAVIRRRSHRP